MKLPLFLSVFSLTLILTAVFLIGLDRIVGKALLAFGSAFLVSASFRFIDAARKPTKE